MLGRSMQAFTLCLGNHKLQHLLKESQECIWQESWSYSGSTTERLIHQQVWTTEVDISIGNPQRWIIGCVLHYVLVSSLLQCLSLPIKSLGTVSRHTSQMSFMHSAWNISLKRAKDLVLSWFWSVTTVVTLCGIVCIGYPKTHEKAARPSYYLRLLWSQQKIHSIGHHNPQTPKFID